MLKTKVNVVEHKGSTIKRFSIEQVFLRNTGIPGVICSRDSHFQLDPFYVDSSQYINNSKNTPLSNVKLKACHRY